MNHASEHSTPPKTVIVHDPVRAGALRRLESWRDETSLVDEFLFRSHPNAPVYARQHRALVETLERNVERVVYLEDLIGDREEFRQANDNPNQIFTRDSVVTLPWSPHLFLPSRMKPRLRRAETASMALALEILGLRPAATLPEDTWLEGGDAIPFSRAGKRTLLLGYGPRTSFEAAVFLAERLIPENLDEIVAIRLADWRLNLDGGLVPVAEDVVVCEPESILSGLLIDSGGRSSIDVLGMFRELGVSIVEVTRDESIYSQACNCSCLGDRKIVYYDLCDRVRRLLEEHGLEVLTVPGSELVKGRGGPRCMTRPVYNDQS